MPRDDEELVPTDDTPTVPLPSVPTDRLGAGSLTDVTPEASEADVLDQARPVVGDDDEEWPR